MAALLAALLAACGGGGGSGDDAPGTPLPRATVAKETVATLQGAPVDGSPGRGVVHVCPGLDDEGRARHMLIVVRGFSPRDTNRQPPAGELEATCASLGAGNDYHTLVVRYRNGADMIQRNAGFVRAVIEWAIERYGLTAADRVALQGISMGGVVTRHALQSMETAGRPHLVDLWLSVDAPQRGAYIPIGLQHLANLYRDRGGAEALAVADTPAARQMLTHHHRQGNSAQTWTDDHQRLYVDELNGTLGGFPRAPGLRRVAVSSGRIGDVLQAPRPGQRYVAGRLPVFTGNVPVQFRQSDAGCTVSVDLNLPLVSTLVLEAFPLGLQANQAGLVARSDVETRVAGYNIDTQVGSLTNHISDRVSVSGLLGLCGSFASRAKATIVRQAVDAAVARGRGAAAPFTAVYEKTFEARGDGIHSEGAPGGRSNYVNQLRQALTQAGFSSEPGVAGGGTHLFVSVASALNIPVATGRMDLAALQANSPFDQIYVESDRNLDHLSSTSGYFARELGALFRR